MAAGGSAPWRVGDVVDGRYRVRRVHEQGGMGLVYRVRHLDWGTDLAMKCPRAELFADPADRAMFVAEAETWVSLGLHPNVCACHYVRLIDGVPCVFAEYVPGGSLLDWIRDGRLYAAGALPRVLDFAIQMAWGLEHAHAVGLVHQDVKPANVLVGADGTAKITDFGLARARPPGSGLGATASADGASVLVPTGGMTPAYASPEQAEGRPLGRRTDVYSYAASVLEMFTGEVSWSVGPVAGAALESMRGQRAEGGPGVVPDAVADVLAACLESDPERRPRTMAEVADRFAAVYERLTGRPHPRPVPGAARLRADELNNRGLSLLDLGRPADAADAFAQALGADPHHLEATYNRALLAWRRGETADDQVVAELESARESARESAADPWPARHVLGLVHLERGAPDEASGPLDEAARDAPGDAEVAAARDAARSESTPRFRRTVARTLPWQPVDKARLPWQRRGSVELAIRFAPDGATAVTGDSTGGLGLWDVARQERLAAVEAHERRVVAVDVDAGGRHAVSAGADNTVRAWDLRTGRCLHTWPVPPKGPAGLAVGDVRLAGPLVHCATATGRVLVWRLGTGEQVADLDGGTEGLRAVDAAGTRIAAGGWDADLHVWDGATARGLAGHTGPIEAVRVGPDGRLALSAGREGTGRAIRLWDLESGACLRTMTGHRDEVTALEFRGDRHAVSTGRDRTVRFWDLPAGRCVRTLRGHRDVIGALAVPSPDLALTAADDGTVLGWALPDRPPLRVPYRLSRPRGHAELHELDVRATALVSEAERAMVDGRYADALGALERARALPGHARSPLVLPAWRKLGRHSTRAGLRSLWPSTRLTGHRGFVQAVDIADGAPVAASAATDRTVRIWDLDQGTCLRVLEGHANRVEAVGLSADGTRALSLDGDRTVILWNTETGEHSQVTGRSTGYIGTVRISADGRTALIAADRDILLWDLTGAGGPLLRLTGHRDTVRFLDFGPDGRSALSAGDDSTARLWDLATGECVREFAAAEPRRPVRSAHLNPAGDHLLTCADSRDGRIMLWSVATGERVRAVRDPAVGSAGAAPTADGRFAVSAARGGAIQVWDLHDGTGTASAPAHAQGVLAVAVSRDGRHALTGGADGETQLWELDWQWTVPGPADRP